MGSAKDFKDRRRKIAQRFLRTAVVVDDEAYMAPSQDGGPKAEVVAPGRQASVSRRAERDTTGHSANHTLDAGSLVNSFSALGVICGVVAPADSAMEAIRQADIVVLDWLLQNGDCKYTLNLLRKLLVEDKDRNSLRLVAIYTGEPRLGDIYSAVFERLKRDGFKPKERNGETSIPYRHGRVVLYAKPDVNLAKTLKDRSVAEVELPGKLAGDFASMTEGLLPGIALTALTAVRQGEHQILGRFSAELDSAFLSHMACLSDPGEAEMQMVEHVAEEIRGLAAEAVADGSPAGAQAVEGWIQNDGRTEFQFGDKTLDAQETVDLVAKGLERNNTVGRGDFKHLSKGFDSLGIADMDERLAWIMNFRTVFSAPPPRLWLGSVVTMGENGRHLICMRPRCDSVRLSEETTFIFLPLDAPSKATTQIIVRMGDEFQRLGIQLDPADWVLQTFKPSNVNRAVTAKEQESGGGFEFTDTCGRKYMWRGELKAEYAQRIAQTFAGTLSRVAVDESEWLRRIARSSG